MKFKKVKLSALFFLSFGLAGLHAQTSIVATGGNALGSEGSMSYSVGQLVSATFSGTAGTTSPGLQQPYEISTLTGLDDAKGINLVFDIYPNPTTDFIVLKLHDFDKSNIVYHLYDINAKLLISKKINEDQTRINMTNYIPAIYIIKVIQENREIKTFRIIKSSRL